MLIKKLEVLFTHLAEFVERRPLAVVLIALALSLMSGFVLATRFDVRSDLKDLMPADAPSVVDTFKISERVGSISTLQIILEAPDLGLNEAYKQSQSYKDCVAEYSREGRTLFGDPVPSGQTWCDNALVAFGREFVKSLETMDIVGNVQFRKDKAFFEQNVLLYAPTHELERAYEEIDSALGEARRMSGEYKACLLVATKEGECDELEPSLEKMHNSQATTQTESQDGAKTQSALSMEGMREQLIERYQKSELSAYKEFPLYRLADGAWMLKIEVRFKDSATGLRSIQSHVEEISKMAQTLHPENYHAKMIIDYGGALKDMQNEYKAIVNDIVRSVGLTLLNIFLLLVIFFRSLRIGARILLPLIMGTMWTLALTFVTIGYLNLITAFIFAILLGLGIDYGIHLYARFELERSQGKDTNTAMTIAMRETGTPIFFGTLTTMATFFTLLLSGFRGFSQFGLVAGIGVFISFVSMITVMPALSMLMERLRPTKIRPLKEARWARWQSTPKKRILSIAICSAMLLLIAYAGSKIPEIQFEDNFYNLQLKQSTAAETQSRYKAAASTRHGSPAIVLFDSPEQVSAFQRQIDRRRSDITYYQTRRMAMFLPNTLQQLNVALAPLYPHLDRYRFLLVTDLAQAVLPSPFFGYLPLGTSYSPKTGQVMRITKEVASKYPNFTHLLSTQLLPEALEQSHEWVALKRQDWLAGFLPNWALQALPDNRKSDVLHSIQGTASIFSYMPTTQLEQAKRLGIIAQIAERTSDRNIRFLPSAEKEKIAQLRPYLVSTPLTIDDLPLWVKIQFKESGTAPLPARPESGVDFAFGNIALVYQLTSTYNGFQAHLFTDEMRSIRVDNKPLVTATGAFVYSDILRLVQEDGVRISAMALILVLLIVFIQQRCLVATLIVTIPLFGSVLLTLLTMIVLDLKLGLFNMVILPVVLGIGIDGSIYLYQRYRTLGRGSCFVALREVGGAIFMSSATTLVGFGSMITSQHMGLNTMGQLSIIGVAFCFIGTVLIMPGLICLAEALKIKSAIPDFDYEKKA